MLVRVCVRERGAVARDEREASAGGRALNSLSSFSRPSSLPPPLYQTKFETKSNRVKGLSFHPKR